MGVFLGAGAGDVTVANEVEIKNDSGNPVPVSDNNASLTVDGSVSVSNLPASYPVTDNGGSLTVDGSVSVSNLPASYPVTDNGGSLTVDGTVTANVAVGSTGESTVSTFTSTTSATLKADNSSRKLLTIFNEGAGNLHVLYGAGTASTTNYSVRVNAGDYLEIEKYTGEVRAIFATAGTARVTEILT